MGKNTMKMTLSGFEELITRLDKAHGNLKSTVTDAMEHMGKTIGDDTDAALEEGNLPAKGKYSTGETRKAVVKNPSVKWNGPVASIKVGFDYTRARAAGYLIAGTPKMRPVKRLRTMYKGVKYPQQLKTAMERTVEAEIARTLGG